jgi:hypothetical protein
MSAESCRQQSIFRTQRLIFRTIDIQIEDKNAGLLLTNEKPIESPIEFPSLRFVGRRKA